MSKHRLNIPVLVSLTILILTIFFITTSSSQGVDATAEVTVGSNLPTMGSVTIYDEDEVPWGDYTPGAATDYTITCNAVATDLNGWGDITNVNATLYHSGKSSDAASDDNDVHYTNSSCLTWGGSGTDVNANCTFYMAFWADDGAIIDTDHWICNMTAWDDSGSGSENASLTIQIQRGFNVSSTIGFGTLALNEISSTDVAANTGNLGNDGTDIQVNSTDMTCDITGTIPVGNIHYNTTSGQDYTIMCPLTPLKAQTCPALNESLDLTDCEDACAAGYTNSDTYWKIQIPASGVDGTCSSPITFTAIDDGTD